MSAASESPRQLRDVSYGLSITVPVVRMREPELAAKFLPVLAAVLRRLTAALTTAEWFEPGAITVRGPGRFGHDLSTFPGRLQAGRVICVSGGATGIGAAARTLEAPPHGARVNAVNPGVIDTPMVRREILAAAEPKDTAQQSPPPASRSAASGSRWGGGRRRAVPRL